MKKLLLTSLMLIGASNVFAQSITCKLDVLLADKAGYLMPSEENLSITTNLVSVTEASAKNCAKVNRNNLQISLCATETDFVGGYNVAAIIQTDTEGEFPTFSTSVLATLKNGKGLAEISAERSILNTFQEKMLKAGISTPQTLGADSAPLDDAVKEGMNKGVLTPNEPVVISVGDCQLNKQSASDNNEALGKITDLKFKDKEFH